MPAAQSTLIIRPLPAPLTDFAAPVGVVVASLPVRNEDPVVLATNLALVVTTATEEAPGITTLAPGPALLALGVPLAEASTVELPLAK